MGRSLYFRVPVTDQNALTIDVEDWYHICGLAAEPDVLPAERRVRQNVESVLALLEEFGIKATFFILGSVADDDPALAPMIAGKGHEIASHGWSHRLVSTLSPDEFRNEIQRTGRLLEGQTGCRPIGFRAPQWSVSRAATPWVFKILREEGYRYDSSCNPLSLVGDPQGPRAPFKVDTPAGSLIEIPPMVTPTPFGNLPTGGGWGFRLFPQVLIAGTIRRLNRDGLPAVLYLHPREMESDGPRLKLSSFRSFAAYGPRSDAVKRLRNFLDRFRFTTLTQLVDSWDIA